MKILPSRYLVSISKDPGQYFIKVDIANKYPDDSTNYPKFL